MSCIFRCLDRNIWSSEVWEVQTDQLHCLFCLVCKVKHTVDEYLFRLFIQTAASFVWLWIGGLAGDFIPIWMDTQFKLCSYCVSYDTLHQVWSFGFSLFTLVSKSSFFFSVTGWMYWWFKNLFRSYHDGKISWAPYHHGKKLLPMDIYLRRFISLGRCNLRRYYWFWIRWISLWSVPILLVRGEYCCASVCLSTIIVRWRELLKYSSVRSTHLVSILSHGNAFDELV